MSLDLAEKRKSRHQFWLHRILVAGLLTVTIQLIFTYTKYGEVFRTYEITTWIELTFTLFYFVALFWFYPMISSFIHSSALNQLRPLQVKLIEGASVVLSTLVFTAVMKLFPLWILLLTVNARYENIKMRFDVSAVRQSLIVHAVLGLLLYYFVERERIRKQIQAEHLRYAKLQREEFKNQLENLKNQVNPHFLFSNLKTLDPLIEKDPEEAVEFVNRLSYVYRSFVDRRADLIPLANEMQVVKAYAYLLGIRSGNNIKFHIKVSNEDLHLQLPPGCTQVIIESAVLHKEISAETPILLNISTKDEKLLIRIDQEVQSGKTSTAGFKSIVERYKYFTDEPVDIRKTEKEFVVKLPLLRLEEEEDKVEKQKRHKD